MSSLGPFITALSHFQWSCSRSANKRVNGSGAAFREEKIKIKSTLLLPLRPGLWHTLSNKSLHLQATRCPLSRKGIIYLKVDFHFFFSRRYNSSSANAPPLHCLLCCALQTERQRFRFWFLALSSLLTPLHPPLLRLLCCVRSLARGVLLLWEAAVCLAFWWISCGDILSMSPAARSTLLIFTDSTRARPNPDCSLLLRVAAAPLHRSISTQRRLNVWVFFF